MNRTREEVKYENWKAKTETERGISVDLSYDQWRKVRKVDCCYYTKRKFVHIKDHPYSKTLERINPEIGYEEGNVVCVTLLANQAKSDFDAFWLNKRIPLSLKVNLCRLVSLAYKDFDFGEEDEPI